MVSKVSLFGLVLGASCVCAMDPEKESTDRSKRELELATASLQDFHFSEEGGLTRNSHQIPRGQFSLKRATSTATKEKSEPNPIGVGSKSKNNCDEETRALHDCWKRAGSAEYGAFEGSRNCAQELLALQNCMNRMRGGK